MSSISSISTAGEAADTTRGIAPIQQADSSAVIPQWKQDFLAKKKALRDYHRNHDRRTLGQTRLQQEQRSVFDRNSQTASDETVTRGLKDGNNSTSRAVEPASITNVCSNSVSDNNHNCAADDQKRYSADKKTNEYNVVDTSDNNNAYYLAENNGEHRLNNGQLASAISPSNPNNLGEMEDNSADSGGIADIVHRKEADDGVDSDCSSSSGENKPSSGNGLHRQKSGGYSFLTGERISADASDVEDSSGTESTESASETEGSTELKYKPGFVSKLLSKFSTLSYQGQSVDSALPYSVTSNRDNSSLYSRKTAEKSSNSNRSPPVTPSAQQLRKSLSANDVMIDLTTGKSRVKFPPTQSIITPVVIDDAITPKTPIPRLKSVEELQPCYRAPNEIILIEGPQKEKSQNSAEMLNSESSQHLDSKLARQQESSESNNDLWRSTAVTSPTDRAGPSATKQPHSVSRRVQLFNKPSIPVRPRRAGIEHAIKPAVNDGNSTPLLSTKVVEEVKVVGEVKVVEEVKVIEKPKVIEKAKVTEKANTTKDNKLKGDVHPEIVIITRQDSVGLLEGDRKKSAQESIPHVEVKHARKARFSPTSPPAEPLFTSIKLKPIKHRLYSVDNTEEDKNTDTGSNRKTDSKPHSPLNKDVAKDNHLTSLEKGVHSNVAVVQSSKEKTSVRCPNSLVNNDAPQGISANQTIKTNNSGSGNHSNSVSTSSPTPSPTDSTSKPLNSNAPSSHRSRQRISLSDIPDKVPLPQSDEKSTSSSDSSPDRPESKVITGDSVPSMLSPAQDSFSPVVAATKSSSITAHTKPPISIPHTKNLSDNECTSVEPPAHRHNNTTADSFTVGKPANQNSSNTTSKPANWNSSNIDSKSTNQSNSSINGKPANQSNSSINGKPANQSNSSINGKPANQNSSNIIDKPANPSSLNTTSKPANQSNSNITSKPANQSSSYITGKPSNQSSSSTTSKPANQSSSNKAKSVNDIPSPSKKPPTTSSDETDFLAVLKKRKEKSSSEIPVTNIDDILSPRRGSGTVLDTRKTMGNKRKIPEYEKIHDGPILSFTDAKVVVGNGCLKVPSTDGMKKNLSFNDLELSEVHEYPSEKVMIHSIAKEQGAVYWDDPDHLQAAPDRSKDEPDTEAIKSSLRSSLKGSPVVLGSLASHKPTHHDEFQFGQKTASTQDSPTTPPVALQDSNDAPSLKPAEGHELNSWSSDGTSDILF